MMDKPFDLLIVRQLRNEGAISNMPDEVVAQICQLQRLFLLGRVTV